MLKITKNQGSIQVTADKSGFYPFDGTITFPTNSLFTATSANTDMITFKSTSNGDVQFVGNYKDITISGRSYDTKQKFLTAFSNLANQGSVDAYTKAETDAKIDAKQGKLKAGNGITLTEDATDGTTVVKTAVSLTDNGNGHYAVGDSIKMGDRIAIGEYAYSYGIHAVAVGSDAQASGEGAVAIGHYSVATNDNPLVIRAGYKIIGNSKKSLTVLQSDSNGKLSILKGDDSDERMVIQDEIEALKNAGGGSANPLVNVKGRGNATIADSITDGVAIGSSANVTQENAVAIGRSAASTGTNSIAIGYRTSGSGESNIAIGNLASSSSSGGIAIGDKAETTNMSATAIGTRASAYIPNSIAIGNGATAKTDTPMVINAGGKTVLQSDSNGKLSILKGDGTDERIVLQDALSAGGSGGTVDAYTKAETDNLLNAKQNTLTAGTGITIDENNVISSTGGSGGSVEGLVINADKITAGFEQHVTSSKGLVIIGNKTRAEVNSPYSVLIGQGANASGYGSTAIGFGAGCTSNNYTIAVGYYATTEGAETIAIGDSAKIQGGNGDVIIGANTKSTKAGKAIAIGCEAKTSARYGLSIGYRAETNDTTPLVIKAGKDSNYNPLTVLQSDATGKLSILKGDGTDERMVISDEITALKAEITTLKAEIAALKGGASTGA